MMDEKRNTLFREKSIERISSPEKLNDYIKVANPGVWVTLIAIAVLLIGFLIWACTAKLQTTVKAVVDTSTGVTNCFVSEEYILNGSIKEGMNVECNDQTYIIEQINGEAIDAHEVLTDYAIHLGGFQSGEWIHAISLDKMAEEGTYGATIVIDEISPISFLLNN